MRVIVSAFHDGAKKIVVLCVGTSFSELILHFFLFEMESSYSKSLIGNTTDTVNNRRDTELSVLNVEQLNHFGFVLYVVMLAVPGILKK
jgi:hypothetical protein